ncbi:MAG: hypothetical protein ACLQLH_15610 [Terracidiphilus sp.]|jgi:hypothetical protein
MNLNLCTTSAARPHLALRSAGRLAFVLGALSLATLYLSAAPITYSGYDLNAGPGGPFTNSNAAYSSFAAAAGSLNTITFESSPVGSFSSLTAAPGVTVTGADASGNNLYVNNTPNYAGDPSLDGFNTTPGGANYIEDLAGYATFSFATPIDAFGAYLSGVQLYFYQDKITFSDGTSETINVPGVTDGTGSVDFVGFTDPGKSISSVTITSGAGGYGDYIGIDDVSYNLPGTVTPEPSTEVLMLTGCLALGLLMWKRRAAQVF